MIRLDYLKNDITNDIKEIREGIEEIGKLNKELLKSTKKEQSYFAEMLELVYKLMENEERQKKLLKGMSE
jgi:predicted transcriptional regulator